MPQETIDPYIMSLFKADAEKKGIFYFIDSVSNEKMEHSVNMYCPDAMSKERFKFIIDCFNDGMKKAYATERNSMK